ncbi:PEP/pyruvate-binding domain-containing protein [Chloroflexota bacterium]
MKPQYTLTLADPKATLETTGGKGASLARLVNAGLPVPGGYHVTTAAYRRFVKENNLQPGILRALNNADTNDPDSLENVSQVITAMFAEAPIPDEIAQAVVAAYNNLPGPAPAVAVRSSATAEDLPEASFAGQQETYLNISGANEVLLATRKCWASLWTARAIAYRAHQGIPAEDVALAVVVQSLAPAEVAGILFTANPLNGRRGQMLLSASWGLGEAVVGGLVTPDSLTLDKSTGEVIERLTAEKMVQTVRVAGGTEEQPVPENLRGLPTLDDTQAAELGRLGAQIEALYAMPMDIEWALADGKFAILQARPITALPEPEPPAPTEWKLPKGAYAAMRNNIVELMTDPLTPLFKTFGLNAVNTSMNALLIGFLGDTGVLPSDPIIAVNEYAYYNGSVKFGPMLKIVLDTRGIMKRMFTGAVERWTEDGRPRYLETVSTWEASQWQELSSTELLEAARELAEAAIQAYGALVSGVIPAAWMSEAWFTFTYKFIKRKEDPSAPTFLMGFDSLPIRAEKALYDLAVWAREQGFLADYLAQTATSDLVDHLGMDQGPAGVDAEGWQNWRQRFGDHLKVYGHTIYNLDFGNPVPADDPAPMLETFKFFLSGGGANPHERQSSSADRRQKATQAIQNRLKGRRLKSFNKNLERAQKYAPLREDGLADVGLSYPLLRKMLRELGARFVQAGMIAETDDIFWLIQEEVEEAAARLDRDRPLENLCARIPQRKAIWRSARRAAPPMALPQMVVFGKDLMELKSGARKQNGDSLKGVAASPGVVTAPACVMHGPEDFSKMNTGDVLVASLTTPAWTPLFARACAVVTDIGGPLSHGSIVAREYGIPAVLSVGVATSRIRSGQVITVDGDAGVVLLGNGAGRE